jgi:nucleoside-diphosphate-sugar epimerase
VLVSCGSIYGGARGFPWNDGTVPLPINPLDGARLAVEQMGHCYGRLYGVQFVSVRLFNVYGPRQSPGSLILSMCDSLLAGQPLLIPGDAQAKRDFTFVTDAAHALRLAMSYGASRSEVFNVGSGEVISLQELVQELEAMTGRKASMRNVARVDGGAIDSWADVAKARRALGFTPRVRLREGLRRFVEWYLAEERR